MKKTNVMRLYLIPLSVMFMGCPSTKTTSTWEFSKEHLIAPLEKTDKLEVDIYLDATTSMQGFASTSPTDFSKLIDDIELVVKNTWKESDIQYYKFGTRMDSLSRPQFIQGKSNPKFYADRFTANQINIDRAIEKTDPERVSIIITDLFYKGQDINSVVTSINESAIKNQIEVGVIAALSPFTGTVADVTPNVQLTNEIRPLYVLIFGKRHNINQVFAAFANKPYLDAGNRLLVSRAPMNDYTVDVKKLNDRNNKAINLDQGAVAKYKSFENVFGFRLKEVDQEASMTFEMDVDLDKAFPNLRGENIRFTAYKKHNDDVDSVSTNDLRFENMSVEEGKITGTIVLTNKDRANNISYLVNVGLSNTSPLEMPSWVTQYDAEEYTAAGPKDKTIYLNKLFTEVFTYNTTYNNPVIGKFYLYFRR